MDEYFSNLLVLSTCVQDIIEEWLLQISIGGMKQSIQSEIKLLDVKDVEQAHQKEKLIEEKKKSQRSTIYIPPHLRENGRKDDNPYRKYNSLNWRPRHKCENKNIFLCEKLNTSDDNGEEWSHAPSSNREYDINEIGKDEANITPMILVDEMTVIPPRLSRKHESDASLCSISIVVPEWISEVQSEYVKYLETRKLIEEVENNKATNSKYSWEKDIPW